MGWHYAWHRRTFYLSLIYCLIEAGKIDLTYLARFTNAPVLLDPETGLFLRDDNGKPLIVDRTSGDVVAFDHQGAEPDLRGSHNGATSVFTKMIEHFYP